ncbi:MAG: hypothetical protein H6622_09380 [Halobacteriovoraceae bacterium]|nr:hypothetical protein [Halobacteriovoraceae bacterium]
MSVFNSVIGDDYFDNYRASCTELTKDLKNVTTEQYTLHSDGGSDDLATLMKKSNYLMAEINFMKGLQATYDKLSDKVKELNNLKNKGDIKLTTLNNELGKEILYAQRLKLLSSFHDKLSDEEDTTGEISSDKLKSTNQNLLDIEEIRNCIGRGQIDSCSYFKTQFYDQIPADPVSLRNDFIDSTKGLLETLKIQREKDREDGFSPTVRESLTLKQKFDLYTDKYFDGVKNKPDLKNRENRKDFIKKLDKGVSYAKQIRNLITDFVSDTVPPSNNKCGNLTVDRIFEIFRKRNKDKQEQYDVTSRDLADKVEFENVRNDCKRKAVTIVNNLSKHIDEMKEYFEYSDKNSVKGFFRSIYYTINDLMNENNRIYLDQSAAQSQLSEDYKTYEDKINESKEFINQMMNREGEIKVKEYLEKNKLPNVANFATGVNKTPEDFIKDLKAKTKNKFDGCVDYLQIADGMKQIVKSKEIDIKKPLAKCLMEISGYEASPFKDDLRLKEKEREKINNQINDIRDKKEFKDLEQLAHLIVIDYRSRCKKEYHGSNYYETCSIHDADTNKNEILFNLIEDTSKILEKENPLGFDWAVQFDQDSFDKTNKLDPQDNRKVVSNLCIGKGSKTYQALAPNFCKNVRFLDTKFTKITEFYNDDWNSPKSAFAWYNQPSFWNETANGLVTIGNTYLNSSMPNQTFYFERGKAIQDLKYNFSIFNNYASTYANSTEFDFSNPYGNYNGYYYWKNGFVNNTYGIGPAAIRGSEYYWSKLGGAEFYQTSPIRGGFNDYYNIDFTNQDPTAYLNSPLNV